MNLVTSRLARAHLREDEALVVETAVRLAVDSVLNALFGVTAARSREHQQKVAERDRDIRRLERRLAEMERELRAARECSHPCVCTRPPPGLTGEQNGSGERTGSDAADGDGTGGLAECEMNLSVGVFSGPPSHVSSSHSHESVPVSSPGWPGPAHCSEAAAETAAAAAAEHTSLLSSLDLKQEPPDISAILVQWEPGHFPELSASALKEEVAAPPAGVDEFHPQLHAVVPELLGAGAQTNPGQGRPQVGKQTRKKKRSVPTASLPEEAQRMKRAAWRAASRRYYARKVARQQTRVPLRCFGPDHLAYGAAGIAMDYQDQQRAPPHRYHPAHRAGCLQQQQQQHTGQTTALLLQPEPSTEGGGENPRGGGGGGGILCS